MVLVHECPWTNGQESRRDDLLAPLGVIPECEHVTGDLFAHEAVVRACRG